MIVVDTSALIAIICGEARGRDCLECLLLEDRILLSAGTAAEAFIVATKFAARDALAALIRTQSIETVPVTLESASRAADAYAKHGRGFGRAALNYGDCFAYKLAKTMDCRLLFIGDDFSKTDLSSALSSGSSPR